jgi:hypothetical protein
MRFKCIKGKHNAERKDNNTKKEALGSQVGPNPESYGSYRKLRADIKSDCFSLSKNNHKSRVMPIMATKEQNRASSTVVQNMQQFPKVLFEG